MKNDCLKSDVTWQEVRKFSQTKGLTEGQRTAIERISGPTLHSCYREREVAFSSFLYFDIHDGIVVGCRDLEDCENEDYRTLKADAFLGVDSYCLQSGVTWQEVQEFSQKVDEELAL